MEHPAVHGTLVKAARARGFVHYSELAKMLGIDMDNPHFGAQVGRILGEISTDEVARAHTAYYEVSKPNSVVQTASFGWRSAPLPPARLTKLSES